MEWNHLENEGKASGCEMKDKNFLGLLFSEPAGLCLHQRAVL